MAGLKLNIEDISGEIQKSLDDDQSDSQKSTLINWIQRRRATLRPWMEFVNTKSFSKPRDIAQVGRRIVSNVDTYQTNYIVICLFLSIYCIITSPWLLFALMISGGACLYIAKRGRGQKLNIAGREFSTAEQYAALLTISLPLLFFASAGSAMFWIIGASVFIITLHASLVEPTTQEPDIELDEVKSVGP